MYNVAHLIEEASVEFCLVVKLNMSDGNVCKFSVLHFGSGPPLCLGGKSDNWSVVIEMQHHDQFAIHEKGFHKLHLKGFFVH